MSGAVQPGWSFRARQNDEYMSGTMHFAASTRAAGLSVIWFSNFQYSWDMDLKQLLALLVIVRGAEVNRDAEQDLDWSLYTFAEGTISVFSTAAYLRRIGTSGERVGDGGMLMRVIKDCESFCKTQDFKAVRT